MKKLDSKGFSMAEIIVTFVIVVIIAAIAVPSVMAMLDRSNEMRHSNIARSIFVAVQSELSNKKNNGTLNDLSEFIVIPKDPSDPHDWVRLDLVGGHLHASNEASGLLATELYPDLNKTNQSAMYYLMLSKDGPDDSFLAGLLSRVGLEDDVLQDSICVELNAGTGNVTAVFYSDTFDSFRYSGEGEDSDLLLRREPSPQRGVYLADTTGLEITSLDKPEILLNDGGELPNALYCEALVPSNEESYTITLMDSMGEPILNRNGLPYSLTFIQQGILAANLESGLVLPYSDLRGVNHAGSIVSGVESDRHTVFTSNDLVDPDGGTVYSHYRVVWVIDLLEDNQSGITFANSIHVRYPDIGVQSITARISRTGSDTYFRSNSAHSYYALAANSTYYIRDARHFSNMRYTATDSTNSIRNFVQINDIDFDWMTQFAPLNWVPRDGLIDEGVFSANYSAMADATSAFKLSNLRIQTNHAAPDETENTGLFGILHNSVINAICLEAADISTRQGGNIGALAGRMVNTKITLAAVNANVSVVEADMVQDYGSVHAGGLVGTMENSYIDYSYHSGSYSDEGHGTVTVSGRYGDEINIGGLVGSIVSGRVSDSYNNARVSVASAVKNETEHRVENPVYAPLVYTAYRDVSIGGIAGRNGGTVRNCYSTNFVGDYYAALDAANCGTVVGNNLGQTLNCAGLYNGIPYELVRSDEQVAILTGDELRASADTLGSSFQAGNLTASPDANYHLEENYPYPVLSKNIHRFAWENMFSPIGFEVIGDIYFVDDANQRVDADTETDPIFNNYVKVDLSNSAADNYIGKLRIDVKYRGVSPLYTRVQMTIFTVDQVTGLYEWPRTEGMKYNAYPGPSPADKLSWISNYENDHSFYYTVMLRPNDDVNYERLPFVTGAIDGYVDGDGSDYVYLKAVASGVEVSKTSEFWKISKLPWR